jgi:DNA-binding GntR family transcriptional regulator
MSPIAYALYQHLRAQPEGTNLVMEALTSTLRSSKTAIRAAFAELEAEGLLSYEQEV